MGLLSLGIICFFNLYLNVFSSVPPVIANFLVDCSGAPCGPSGAYTVTCTSGANCSNSGLSAPSYTVVAGVSGNNFINIYCQTGDVYNFNIQSGGTNPHPFRIQNNYYVVANPAIGGNYLSPSTFVTGPNPANGSPTTPVTITLTCNAAFINVYQVFFQSSTDGGMGGKLTLKNPPNGAGPEGISEPPLTEGPSPEASPVNPAQPTLPPPPGTSSGLSSGAIAGIVVGCVVGLLIVLAIIGYFVVVVIKGEERV